MSFNNIAIIGRACHYCRVSSRQLFRSVANTVSLLCAKAASISL